MELNQSKQQSKITAEVSDLVPNKPVQTACKDSGTDHEQEFSIKETGSLKLMITSKRIPKKLSPVREPEVTKPSGIKITIHSKRVRRPDSTHKGPVDSKKPGPDKLKKVQ